MVLAGIIEGVIMHWVIFAAGLLCAATSFALALFGTLGAAATFFALGVACCIAAFERWNNQR